MQHLAEIPTDSLRLSGTSTKPEQLEQAKILIAEAAKRYPAMQPLSRDALTALKQDWAELISEMGLDRFKRKLRGALRESQFFPSIKSIIDAQEIQNEKREPPKRCPRCQKFQGWLYVLVDGFQDAQVVKCPHTEQIKFTVRKEFNGEWTQHEATACDSVPA